MTTCAMFTLFAMLASPVGSAMLRVADEPHRVEVNLQNDEDLSMMATVRLGHQDMRCIMDSGSSEQLFFSSRCETCGDKMYNCDQDPACHWGEQQTIQSYGSGETSSTEVHASMTITSQHGDSSIHQDWQMAWLVTDADFDFQMDGTMQCIFGLGPASSAVEFAQMEVVEMQNYLKTAPTDEKAEYAPLLENLTKHVHFMKGVTLWQEASKLKHFSYCLHPELGKDGRLIFNDPAPGQMPGAFQIVHTSLTNGKDLYWQLDMSDAKIEIPGGKAIEGCKGEGCVAVMDTGTSLVGAPYSFMEPLYDFVMEYVSKWGCDQDALHKYPDFTFKLGDQQFKLPPRAYVCKFDEDGSDLDDGDLSTKRRMPHLEGFKRMQENRILRSHSNSTEDKGFCAPCFFEMDDDGGKDMWLFGLPFFREYYTVFQSAASYKNTDKMLFAQANANCDVMPGKTMRGTHRNHTVQRIKTHKLRLPPTGHRNQRPSSLKRLR